MLNKKVKDIMTTEVITTTSDVDVVNAFEKSPKRANPPSMAREPK